MPILLVVLLTVGLNRASAQLYINEFMPSNTGVVLDPDYKQTADWIEIFNSGNTPVDLGGFFLTDNLMKRTKWSIPAGVQIAAHGYLTFWADNMNTGLHTNFALAAAGEQIGLSDKTGALLDSVVYGVQDNSALYNYGAGSIVVLDSTLLGAPDPNISMGRRTDGSSDWVLFTVPTPGASNNTVGYSDIVKSDPSFTLPGGIYPGTVTIEIKSIFGGDVLYTLDGSEPNEQSMVALAPITITKNTVVRARIYKPGLILGPVSTNTYLIDTDKKINKLPVVCVSSDPVNFWDPVKGIYVVHSTKPEWEIPVNIELFENDGRTGAAFNLKAGIKSTGLYSWQLPEKMMGISFRKEYGAGKLEYPVIFDKTRKVYNSFSLRASGSDWANTMFRDGMVQTAAVENTGIDVSGFRACVVYINGEFMGVHNMREKIDEDYIVGNHGLLPGTFDMIEEVDAGEYVETGDITANNNFLTLTGKDLTIPANYDAVAAEMDIKEFTEMVCTEVYSGNSSIGHNLMKWKPKGSGKWRWILMDLDRSFFGANNQLISFYNNESGWPFKDLMRNQDYKKQFGIKLADLMFTTFNSDRMISEIEAHKKNIEADMPEHIKRWQGTSGTGTYSNIKAIASLDSWLAEVETLKTFAKDRPGVILNDLMNYGFQAPVPVTISTIPAKSGSLTFNGLKIPVDVCSGGYPKGEEIKITAQAKDGYTFLGWKSNSDSLFIGREGIWKYSDTGIDLGTSWKNNEFVDTAWKSGQAELGYGDGGEKTVIGYGGNASNRYITSYFRKNFILSDKQKVKGLTLNLKADDGAVIYLNGNEIQRYNMPTGVIGSATLASSAIAGADESDFHTFSVGPDNLINGNNVVAVEIHQSAANSSDVSFDLEVSATMTGTGDYLSTAKELALTPQSTLNISAIFESDGKCILPAEISTVMTLSKACSPYIVPENVTVTSTGKLIIEPGVELWMSDGVSIYSSAAIIANGTRSEPVVFKSNPGSAEHKWGLIRITNATDTVRLKNVIIENASEGSNPVRDIAALAIDNSTVLLDSITVETVYKNPINLYNCQTTLTNGRIHSDYAGSDEINIKRGRIALSHCEFIGNKGIDSDALDFGEMSEESSSVRNCYFHDFEGSNADAVDLGDHARNVIIDSIIAYNINDKGVSIGQRSSTRITNSVFINCGMGAGMKDSSSVYIDHCTYYGNFYALANYQKHEGDAGSNLVVTNSILSNSYELGYFNDEYSKIDISNSSDDTEKLPDGKNNLFLNPLFISPEQYDFSLFSGSALTVAGTDGKTIGANLKMPKIPVSVMISDIAYLTKQGGEDLEFIGLYNPGEIPIPLDSCLFNSGVQFMFPAGSSIAAKGKIYITSNAASSFWNGKTGMVYQWESGRLADEGEKIQLMNKYGKVMDQVIYDIKAPWPVPLNSQQAISLSRYDVDNHFGENWKLSTLSEIAGIPTLSTGKSISIYPNPSTGIFTIGELDGDTRNYEVFNLQGKSIQKGIVVSGKATINLSGLENGMYLFRSGAESGKLMLIK